MKGDRRSGDARGQSRLYVWPMRRPAKADWVVALTGVALTEWAIWAHQPVGDTIAGRRWLVAPLPLLLDLPLAWRRIAPLAMLVPMTIAILAQCLATWHAPEGLELIYAFGLAAYSVGAYASRRHAFAGL